MGKSREIEELVAENEKNVAIEKPSGEDDAPDANKDNPTDAPEEKEPEDKVHNLLWIWLLAMFAALVDNFFRSRNFAIVVVFVLMSISLYMDQCAGNCKLK